MVGAGVVGLSCAVRIAEAGVEVDVLARDLPRETTSAAAGGLWWPDPAEPTDPTNSPDPVLRWASAGHAEMVDLAERDGDQAGVRILPGTLVREANDPAPTWLTAMPDLTPMVPRPASPGVAGAGLAPGLAPGLVGAGRSWRFAVPLVDPAQYLDHLRARLLAAGGTLTRMSLSALPSRGVVVDCTGLSAHALAADPAVRPARGQVVLLEDPGLTHWLVDEREQDGLTCSVLPYGRRVVVGGCHQLDDWSTAVRPSTATALLRRAVRSVPQLADARVLGHRVGLRPVRPTVRLATEHDTGPDGEPRTVVHCYGHGGSGITLAWGCAGEVRDAVLAERPAITG